VISAGRFFAFFLLVLGLPLMSRAGSSLPSQKSDWGGSLTIAPEVRGVEDSLGNQTALNYLNVAAGVRYQNWNFLLEFGSSDTQDSGNATLAVQTKMQDVLGWVLWNSEESFYRLSPLLGAGLGVYQTKVTTTLSGIATDDESPWKLLGGASVGLKLNIPVVWISLEGRVLFGDELTPQPTLSGLARIGIDF
jgi:hypothetical protein